MNSRHSDIIGEKKNLHLLAFLVSVVGSLLMVVSVFLPFAAAIGEYKEYLNEYPSEMYAEEIEMTNKDAVSISLFEFIRIYSAAEKLGMPKGIAIVTMVIIGLYVLFALLTLIFSLLKKSVASIVFDLLALAVFILNRWDFKDRGVIPNSNYDWGCAEIICYIGIAAVILGAVLLLFGRYKAKKQLKTPQQKEEEA